MSVNKEGERIKINLCYSEWTWYLHGNLQDLISFLFPSLLLSPIFTYFEQKVYDEIWTDSWTYVTSGSSVESSNVAYLYLFYLFLFLLIFYYSLTMGSYSGKWSKNCTSISPGGAITFDILLTSSATFCCSSLLPLFLFSLSLWLLSSPLYF